MSNKNKSLLAVTMALAIVTSSCNIYKKYELPQDGIVGEYTQAVNEPVDSSALGNLAWEEVFTDPILQNYIRQALDNNLDLQNAKLNVDIAHAQLQGAKLSYFPSLTFAPNGSGSSLGGSKMSWGYQLPLSLNWEVDILGRLTNNKRKAKAQLLQSEAYQQAVRSQIIGGVANTYYALVSLNKQLSIYRETAEAWKELVQVMKDMKEAGRFNEVSVVQSKANYHSVLAAIPNIEKSINELNNTMSLLLNTKRQIWAVDSESMISIPDGLDENVPMSYLAQRPDVRAAEQSFAMAYYATNMARSNFYPSVTLSATGGYGTLVGSSIIDPAKWLVNLAGQLTMPIFARGQNIANLKATKAQQQQSLNNFQSTLISAGNEVSNALVTIAKDKEAGINLNLQMQNLKKAVEYNQDLLTLGTTTYLEVLTAQQALLQSQIQVVSNKLSINQAAIHLYQALGGGR